MSAREDRASITADDLVRVRVRCGECGGTGEGTDRGTPMCGECLADFTGIEAARACAGIGGFLPCGHGREELCWSGSACPCCDGGWVEQWTSIAALLRLVPQPAQPARKPRRRSRTNQRKVR